VSNSRAKGLTNGQSRVGVILINAFVHTAALNRLQIHYRLRNEGTTEPQELMASRLMRRKH